MNKLFFLLFLSLLFTMKVFGAEVDTNNRLKNNKLTLTIIGDKHPVMVRIPPPASYTNKSITLSGGAKIIVNFNNFSAPAKIAFQKAVDIWASQIYSPVKIRIDAYWRTLEDSSVLGSCSPTDYLSDYDGMPFSNTYYPIALAEKLAGKNLNDTVDFEMIANFNKDASWYFDTDGNTPSTKYDFVSVVLHEICHGLGFISSFSVDRGLGSWGWGMDTPLIFDRFIVDYNGNSLQNSAVYPNNSVELKKALTSNLLNFSGPLLKAEFGETASLYAPAIWKPGSSISHVSNSYGTGSESLMTYSINYGKSIHDPGVMTVGVLEEIGWKQLIIKHEPIKNLEGISNVTISAKISSDFSTPIINPKLYYSKDSSDYIELLLSKNAFDPTLYSASIPISKNVDVNYYITADDKFGRTFKIPATSPQIRFLRKLNITQTIFYFRYKTPFFLIPL
jgi:hypothetical protein